MWTMALGEEVLDATAAAAGLTAVRADTAGTATSDPTAQNW